jgi:hypothetical protein
MGLLDNNVVALLAWGSRGQDGFELCVRTSPAGDALAAELIERVRQWHAAGRPGDADWRIRAYPRDRPIVAAPGELVIDERWTRFVLDWRSQPPANLTL